MILDFQIHKIKRKSKKLKSFLKSINESSFLINKSFRNTPWIHFGNKNFIFYKIIVDNRISGIAVIINLKLNVHLQFFYISKLYRSLGLGKKIINILLPKYKFTTVHVPKKLTFRTIKFYKNNNFIKSNLKEKNTLLRYWIDRCNNFDKNTFKEKYLLYKNLKMKKLP
jgi:hypothetical protein